MLPPTTQRATFRQSTALWFSPPLHKSCQLVFKNHNELPLFEVQKDHSQEQKLCFGMWLVLAKDGLKWEQNLFVRLLVYFFQVGTNCKDPYLELKCTEINVSRVLLWADCGVTVFLLKQYPNLYSGLSCMLLFIKAPSLATFILHSCQWFYKLPQMLNCLTDTGNLE